MSKPKVTGDLEAELGKTGPTREQLTSISNYVATAAKLQHTIDGLEEAIKASKEEFHLLTTRQLPDAMASAGTLSFKSTDGVKVEVKDFMNGSLPKQDDLRAAALKWLEKNGGKDLIKTTFNLAVGRGQAAAAKEVRAALNKTGLSYNEKEDVHAQTLYAFAREIMKAGKPLPLDTLGLYVGRVAKIELPAKS